MWQTQISFHLLKVHKCIKCIGITFRNSHNDTIKVCSNEVFTYNLKMLQFGFKATKRRWFEGWIYKLAFHDYVIFVIHLHIWQMLCFSHTWGENPRGKWLLIARFQVSFVTLELLYRTFMMNIIRRAKPLHKTLNTRAQLNVWLTFWNQKMIF